MNKVSIIVNVVKFLDIDGNEYTLLKVQKGLLVECNKNSKSTEATNFIITEDVLKKLLTKGVDKTIADVPIDFIDAIQKRAKQVAK